MSNQQFLGRGHVKPKVSLSNWEARQVNAFASVETGGAFGFTKEQNYQSSGIPAYSAAGQDGYVSEAEFRNEMAVILSSIGANCGRCFYAEGDFTTLANVQAIIPDRTVNAKFLFYRVNMDDYWERSGSAQPFIKPSSIKLAWVSHPKDIFEQNKIVEVLRALDTQIEQTEALIAKQENIRQGLMQDLFTRGVDETGQLRPAYKDAPHLYHETELGWLPLGWQPGTLGDFVQFQRGHDIVARDFEEGPYPVVSSGGRIGFHAKFTSKGPGVILGRKGTIGNTHFEEGNYWAHDTSLYSIDLKGSDPKFVFYLCKFLDLGRFGTRTGSPSLNRNDIHPFKLGITLPKEQIRISSRLNQFEKYVAALRAEKSKLQKQKAGLMRDLLSGDVSVTPLMQVTSA